MPCRLARRAIRSVVGPGTDSARSYQWASCEGQKYGPVKISCRPRPCTPRCPASSMRGRWTSIAAWRTFSMGADGSVSGAAAWMRPPITRLDMHFSWDEATLWSTGAIARRARGRAAHIDSCAATCSIIVSRRALRGRHNVQIGRLVHGPPIREPILALVGAPDGIRAEHPARVRSRVGRGGHEDHRPSPGHERGRSEDEVLPCDARLDADLDEEAIGRRAALL